MFKVGCCGFPKGKKEYFSRFKVVEVQQTFYKPPQLATALRWRGQAAPDFEFTIKSWQLITHPPTSPTYRKAGITVPEEKKGCFGWFKPTEEVLQAWYTTEEIATALKAKVIVFQCPPGFKESDENIENMGKFFHTIPRKDFLFAWEPRGGWNEARIKEICHELNLIHCVDPLERVCLHGEVKYYRLHGGPGYRHTYSEEELKQLKELGKPGDYFLFNNITMYDDALRFINLFSDE